MAHAVSVSNQGRQLVCSICQKQFPEMTLSSCFHTFCLDCLRGQVSAFGGSSYRCPICKTTVDLPGEIIRDLNSENYVVEHRGQGYAREHMSQTCDICSTGKTAINRCMQCEESLCENCTNAHLKMKASRYHSQHVIPLTSGGHSSADDLYDLERSRTKKNCWRHRNEEIQFVCKKCDVVLCLICKLLEHENHVTKPISEEASDIRKTLKRLLQKQISLGEKLQMKIREAETKRTQYPLELEQELNKLNYQATKMHAEIEKEKVKAENEMKSHYGDYIQKYETDGQQMKQDYQDYRWINTEALQLVNNDNDLYVVDKGTFLCKRLNALEQDLKSRPDDGHGAPSRRFYYGNIDPVQLQGMMGHVGGQRIPTAPLTPNAYQTQRSWHNDSRETTADRLSNRSHTMSVTSPGQSKANSKFVVPFSDGLGYIYGIAPVDSTKAWITMLDHKIVLLVDNKGNMITSVNVGETCEGVASDEDGGCYVTCPGTKSIKHVTVNGEVETIVSDLPQDPHGVALMQLMNRESNTLLKELYICFTNTTGSTLEFFDNQMGSVGVFSEAGEDLGRSFTLQSPVRIAVHAESNSLCVADHSHGCVTISDMSGQYVKAIYTGLSDHELFKPLGVCFDDKGNVIVADWRGNNVSLVNKDGEFLRTLSQDVDGPQSVAYRNRQLWIGGKLGAVCVKPC